MARSLRARYRGLQAGKSSSRRSPSGSLRRSASAWDCSSAYARAPRRSSRSHRSAALRVARRRLVRRSAFRNLFVAAFVLACTGCVLHIHREPATRTRLSLRTAASRGAAVRHVRAHSGRALGAVRRDTHARDRAACRSARAATTAIPTISSKASTFASKEAGRKSLVVVMPIWGTSSYPPAKISTGYARRAGNDTHVIWIYGDAPVFPWTELELRADRRRLQGARARQRRTLSLGGRRHAAARRLGGDAARDRCVAHRVRRLQHERARHGHVACERAARIGRRADDGRGAIRRHVLDVPQPCRRRARARLAHLRLDDRRVSRVLQGAVRSRRSRALRGPLRSQTRF